MTELEPDYLLVSGDLTNNGDAESLNKAQDWLLREFGIGGGNKTGLHFAQMRLGIVPGNRDVRHRSVSGRMRERWARSLDPYNRVFIDNRINQTGYYFRWIENKGGAIFLAFADSSFLGSEDRADFGSRARGKLIFELSRNLLELCEKGTLGRLNRPSQPNSPISAPDFQKSLKVLVLHHGPLTPKMGNHEPLSRHQSDDLARDLILAGFDLILCGHGHHAGVIRRACGEILDDRARRRLVMNVFRRNVGLHVRPLQTSGRHGRRLSKALAWFTEFFAISQREPLTPEGLADALYQALNQPRLFRSRVKELLRNAEDFHRPAVDLNEIDELKSQVMTRFSREQRQQLTRVIRPLLGKALKQVNQRSILQYAAGSVAKQPGPAAPVRSFNSYDLKHDSKELRFVASRFSWDMTTKTFESTWEDPREFPPQDQR